MLERLEVHGKTYEPIAAVAFDVPFDEATLQQLASAKAVTAAYIDRQWFVERDSVWQYHARSQDEQKRRLQATRKVDRAAQVKQIYLTKTAPPSRIVLWLEAGTVVTCGLLVGLLFSSSYQTGVGVEQLQAGALQALSDLESGLSPSLSLWRELSQELWSTGQ